MPDKRPTVKWQEMSLARQRERVLLRALAEFEAEFRAQEDHEKMPRSAERARGRRAVPSGDEARVWRLFDLVDRAG